jgi:GntR family transcriptional repressor for pyruvate dehydrogenase complex
VSSVAVPLSGLVPTRKRRLADDLYGQLLQQLNGATYEVGAKLPSEGQLAQAFGVSRPIVREALQRLQDDGIISARRGSGTFVARLPPAEVTSAGHSVDIASYMRTFEVRVCLEPEAARLAARRRSATALADLGKALRQFEDALSSGDRSSEADFAFHLEIAKASMNELFVGQMMALQKVMVGAINITSEITRGRPHERRLKVLKEHEDILAAIEAHDEDGARAYMLYHLTEVRNRITDARR